MKRLLPTRGAASLVVAAVAWCCLSPVAAAAEDSREQYFDGLRRRRLFSVAEGYCLERLADEELEPQARRDFTLELARTFAEHARYTLDPERADLFHRAERTLQGYLDGQGVTPDGRLLARVELAFLADERAETLEWDARLSPFDAALRERASETLHEAATQLGARAEELDDLYRRSLRRNRPASGLPAFRLKALQRQLAFRRAQALLDRAALAPPDAPRRAPALEEASAAFEELAEGVPDDPLTMRAQVGLAAAARLRGDTEAAQRTLLQLEGDQPPQAILDGIVAEKARLMLAGRRPDEAARGLVEYRRTRGPLPGPLRFVMVQALVGMWTAATTGGQESIAADAMARLEAYVQAVETQVGGFWGYRCRVLLDSARHAQKYGPEVAALARKAEGLYRAGQQDAAIQAYGRAAALAERRDRPQVAMELGLTRASIALRAGRIEQSAEDLRSLAERFPDDERAARAHLLYAYALGRMYDRDRGKDRTRDRERVERYLQTLQQHRERYADSPTRHDAAWMLAWIQERRNQFTDALEFYAAIPYSHRHGPRAADGAGRMAEAVMQRVRRIVRERNASAREVDRAIAYVSQRLQRFLPADGPLDAHQARVALRLARMALDRSQPDHERANALLARVERGWQPQDRQGSAADWNGLRRSARQLRILALAGSGKVREARRFVESLSESEPAEVLHVLDGLAPIASEAPPAVRRELGELQLSASLLLDERRDELSAEDQRRLDRCLADAYLATRQRGKAIRVYESLLEDAPRDRQLLETLGELLSACSDRDCAARAKKVWRRLEGLAQPGSATWFDARYHVVRETLRLRQTDEAQKLLALTKVLYPDLGGPESSQRFARLERSLSQDE